MFQIVGNVVDALPFELVADTDLDGFETVEDIQFHQRDPVAPVEGAGVTDGHGVEPAAAAGAARRRAELVSLLSEPVAVGTEILARERAVSDAGAVGFGDAGDTADLFGRKPHTGAGAPGDRVGAGDVGVGAVVDVEHRSLGPFEQDLFPRLQISPDHLGRIGDVGHQPVAITLQIGFHLPSIGHLHSHRFEDRLVLFQVLHHLLEKRIDILQLPDPVAGAGDFVGVGGTDAPARRADRLVATHPLLRLVDQLVIGEDQMGLVTHPEPPFEIVELAHLLHQIGRADDDAVADDVDRFGIENSRGNQVQRVLLPVGDDRVAGVVAARETRDHFVLLGQHVDDLAFAFVTPLQSYDKICLIHLSFPFVRASISASV